MSGWAIRPAIPLRDRELPVQHSNTLSGYQFPDYGLGVCADPHESPHGGKIAAPLRTFSAPLSGRRILWRLICSCRQVADSSGASHERGSPLNRQLEKR
jgi:hypothetical protein